MVKELTKDYKQTLKQETQPYVIEFYTPTCGFCKQVMPLFEEVAEKYKDKYGFYKLNAEELTDIAKEYKVTQVPTLLFIDRGFTKHAHHGYLSKDDIIAKLNKAFE